MWEALDRLFSGQFMLARALLPCGRPSMVWLQVGSNLLIALAYLSISLTLAYIVRKIKDIPFSWMYVTFGVFIIALRRGRTPSTSSRSGIRCLLVRRRPSRRHGDRQRGLQPCSCSPLVPKAIALADATAARSCARPQARSDLRGAGASARGDEVARATEKTDFFANISHELRTPLALILGTAGERASEREPHPRRRCVISRSSPGTRAPFSRTSTSSSTWRSSRRAR